MRLTLLTLAILQQTLIDSVKVADNASLFRYTRETRINAMNAVLDAADACHVSLKIEGRALTDAVLSGRLNRALAGTDSRDSADVQTEGKDRK